MEAQTGADSGLKAWQQCALFLCAGLLLASRRPDALLHAQFYAEDGHVWFADAYNLGWWTTLFRTQDGYFQTLPRIGAALALHAPLKLAPLLMNLLAIAVQALPVNILLSARSSAWGSLRHRAMMAFLYLAIPNSGEMTVILTSTQWVLALIVFLLLVARKAAGIPGRVLDNSMVILCGLTGPFCLFLFPVAIIVAWNKRDVWRWMNAGSN